MYIFYDRILFVGNGFITETIVKCLHFEYFPLFYILNHIEFSNQCCNYNLRYFSIPS